MSRLCIVGFYFIAAVSAVAAFPAVAAPTAAFSRKSVVITHVSVVDVAVGRVLHDRTVLLQGGRIVRIGSASKVKVPSSAQRIEGKGRFLLPGLFDCHVHLNDPERESRMLVANGVTFVRDMGGNAAERFALRARAQGGQLFGLQMACVGTILDGSPPYHGWSRACATPDEGRRAVQEMKTAGADQIKVYSLLKPQVHRAICAEAKRLGMKVVGHVPDALTLEEAIVAGQQGVEHLTGFASLLAALLPKFTPTPGEFDGGLWARYSEIDKDKLRTHLSKLAETGAAQCPTLTLHAGQARILDVSTRTRWNKYVPPDDRQGWTEIPARYAAYGRSQQAAFPHLQQTVLEMQRAGIPLLIGTDLGNPGVLAGFGVHTEMRLWQEAGLHPVEILRAATIIPARFLGVEADWGSVAVGKIASLVLTSKNPLEDVRNAAQIEAVFEEGRYFNRAALDRLLREAREEVLARSPVTNPKVSLELPGEIVAQGRYDLFFEQYGDGTEEFKITREGDAYHYKAVRRQQGFGRVPTVLIGTWKAVDVPEEVQLDALTLLPTVERYKVSNGRLQGNVTRKGRALHTTNIALPAQMALRSSFLSSDYFLLQKLKDMATGETRRVETCIVGGSEGRPRREFLNVIRQPDDRLLLTGKTSELCRRFLIQRDVEANTSMEVWMNSKDIVVKQLTTEGVLKRSALLVPAPLDIR